MSVTVQPIGLLINPSLTSAFAALIAWKVSWSGMLCNKRTCPKTVMLWFCNCAGMLILPLEWIKACSTPSIPKPASFLRLSSNSDKKSLRYHANWCKAARRSLFWPQILGLMPAEVHWSPWIFHANENMSKCSHISICACHPYTE